MRGVAADGARSGRSTPGRSGRRPMQPACLVAAAHRNAKETLAELRDLVRGIHPPVLDRGLGAALGALAETSPVPVALSVRRHRTALAGHRGHRLLLRGRTAGQRGQAQWRGPASRSASPTRTGGLVMTVTDDGAGGARLAPAAGSPGCSSGCRRSTGALGIDSPAGGPTVITITLPGHA